VGWGGGGGSVGGGGAASAAPAAAPAAPEAVSESNAAANGQADVTAEVWGRDEEGLWEVRARYLDSQTYLVRGVKDGEVIWEQAVVSAVQYIEVGGGFAALASGHELHVLSVASGLMVFPPLVMGSPCYRLALTSRGHLLALLRDATLAVWDINATSCTVQTSLQGLCQPAELELLDLRLQTGEPFLQLRDGRVLLFQRDLQAWTSLTESKGPAADPGQGPAVPRPTAPSLDDALHLEGDMLAAACLGDAEEFCDRLEELVFRYAQHEPTRLRSCCAALLDRSAGAPVGWAWLAKQLAGMGLDGRALLEEVVIPGLGPGMAPNAQELRAELQEMLSDEKVTSVL